MQRAPGFPCTLLFFGGGDFSQSSGASRREKAELYLRFLSKAIGFGLAILSPNNRYVNDEQIAQAVAQMLTRGGVPTKVVSMPSAVTFIDRPDARDRIARTISALLEFWMSLTNDRSIFSVWTGS